MKRALVTGGSGAIGSAIAKHLASMGLQVIVHGLTDDERTRTVAADIRSTGGNALTTAFDVTDAEATHSALATLLQAGPIQVLVNNAGIHADAPMAGMDREQWSSVMHITLDGFFNVTQPLLLPMMATRWGRIINTSSVAAVLGNRGQVNYAAAKAGLHGATKSLARELASRGITVNAIAPGIIDTAMTEQVFDDAKIRQIVPMQRAGTTDEVASLVAFLSSDQAGYISGQIISIDGAMT